MISEQRADIRSVLGDVHLSVAPVPAVAVARFGCAGLEIAHLRLRQHEDGLAPIMVASQLVPEVKRNVNRHVGAVTVNADSRTQRSITSAT